MLFVSFKQCLSNFPFQALKEIEFEHLVPELDAQLANYRKIMKSKKDRKSINEANTEKITEDVEEVDDDVEIMDE